MHPHKISHTTMPPNIHTHTLSHIPGPPVSPNYNTYTRTHTHTCAIMIMFGVAITCMYQIAFTVVNVLYFFHSPQAFVGRMSMMRRFFSSKHALTFTLYSLDSSTLCAFISKSTIFLKN